MKSIIYCTYNARNNQEGIGIGSEDFLHSFLRRTGEQILWTLDIYHDEETRDNLMNMPQAELYNTLLKSKLDNPLFTSYPN